MTRAVICVGFRPGSTPLRDALWAKVQPELRAMGLPIYTGEPDPGPFNHAQAMNRAAAAAGDWDVAVFMDADSFLDPQSTAAAVMFAARDGQAVWPYDRIQRRDYTGAVLAVETMEESQELVTHDLLRNAVTGALYFYPFALPTSHIAVPRALYERVGGWDERLSGYGFEDGCFEMALDVLGGGLQRVPGRLVMYEHPRDADRNEHIAVPYSSVIRGYIEAFQWRSADRMVMALGRPYIMARDGSLRLAPGRNAALHLDKEPLLR